MLFKAFLVVSYETVMQMIFALPRYAVFCWLKRLLLMAMGATVGRHLVIYPGVWIAPGRKLVIGDDVDLAKDVIITTSGGVSIGDRALIGYRTQILSADHRIPPIGERFGISGDVFEPIAIGED